MASKLAPLWFISNYSYAISLRWTTIASSTVLASMGSIFAFIFATCTRYGDERVTWVKVVGVSLCFMGGVATAWTDAGAGGGNSASSLSSSVDNHDNNNNDENRNLLHRLLQHSADLANSNSSISWTLVGDFAGLLSAMGYGAYTVLLRHLCPKDENRMSMQLLFGYVGLLNMITLFPVALYLILTPNHDRQSSDEGDNEDDNSSEQHATTTTTLTWTIFLYLIGMGLVDNVISDYLWARAVILTSATVASVGLGLTIPMAFLADKVMGSNTQTHLGDILGAFCVLLGFVFVNIRQEEMGFSRINSLPDNNRTSVVDEEDEG
jgi:solute carrier family 35 protein F5